MPSCIVIANAKLVLKLPCANSRRVCRNQVRRPKPFLNRDVRPMHDCTGHRIELLPTGPISDDGPRCNASDGLARTFRTNKSVRPLDLYQILKAIFIGGELSAKLSDIFWILWPTHVRIGSTRLWCVNQVSIRNI